MLRSGFLEAKPEEVSVQPEAEEVEQSAWAVTEQVQEMKLMRFGSQSGCCTGTGRSFFRCGVVSWVSLSYVVYLLCYDS